MLTTFHVTDRKAPSYIGSAFMVLIAPLALLAAAPCTASVNQYPDFFPNPYAGTAVGHLLEFQLSASDPDGDELTWSCSGLPSGAQFDLSTHVFSWTPQEGDEGEYVITFTVDDGHGGIVSRQISIRVVEEGEWFMQYKGAVSYTHLTLPTKA